MATPASHLTTRLAYGARQLPRVAWYVGHSLVMRRLAEMARERDGEQDEARPSTGAPAPDRRRLYADMVVLFQQDLANVEAGVTPCPQIMMAHCPFCSTGHGCFSRICQIFIAAAKRRGPPGSDQDTRGKRPSYYLQNFHFQSGGWMTKDLHGVMTRKWKYSSTAPRTSPVARRWCRCMRYSRVVTSGGSDY
jgi:hypothetical protein